MAGPDDQALKTRADKARAVCEDHFFPSWSSAALKPSTRLSAGPVPTLQ
jgi:hypothetical protein